MDTPTRIPWDCQHPTDENQGEGGHCQTKRDCTLQLVAGLATWRLAGRTARPTKKRAKKIMRFHLCVGGPQRGGLIINCTDSHVGSLELNLLVTRENAKTATSNAGDSYAVFTQGSLFHLVSCVSCACTSLTRSTTTCLSGQSIRNSSSL